MSEFNETVMRRLKNVMLTDVNNSMEAIIRVLKSDIYMLLSEYMAIESDSFSIAFTTDEDGSICLYIEAQANQIISAGYVLSD